MLALAWAIALPLYVRRALAGVPPWTGPLFAVTPALASALGLLVPGVAWNPSGAGSVQLAPVHAGPGPRRLGGRARPHARGAERPGGLALRGGNDLTVGLAAASGLAGIALLVGALVAYNRGRGGLRLPREDTDVPDQRGDRPGL